MSSPQVLWADNALLPWIFPGGVHCHGSEMPSILSIAQFFGRGTKKLWGRAFSEEKRGKEEKSGKIGGFY